MREIATLLIIAESSISPEAIFAIALVLAVVVIGVSLWLFRNSNAVSRRRLVKRCPYCNALMEPGVHYCPNCGREVPEVTIVT